ncbi:MAG: hypothetical protein JW982_07935 [Spirochaetes bacterium]|nr:hypothetical protein [Spirochaetota bacterium]
MKLHLKFSIILMFVIVCVFAACDDKGGSGPDSSGGGVVNSNITVTGISASRSQITITWNDPQKSDLDHIDVVLLGMKTDFEIELSAGVGQYSFDSLSEESLYSITFISYYTNGDLSDENVIYVSTTASGTVIHKPILTAAALVNAVTDADGLEGNYFLTADLDLSAYQTGSGWIPLGSLGAPFKGILNGNGFSVRGLVINDDATADIGFFGNVDSAAICNIIIINALIVNGNGSKLSCTGGLIGEASNSKIMNCVFSGSVSGIDCSGGLVGLSFDSSISNCYSTCTVTGNNNSGGLVGISFDSLILNCYSNGTVTGAEENTGGLVGWNSNSSISNCYSISVVSGNIDTGGLIGFDESGFYDNSYWNTDIFSSSQGGTGRTTLEMKDEVSYSDWDFTAVWDINADKNDGYPFLRNMP